MQTLHPMDFPGKWHLKKNQRMILIVRLVPGKMSDMKNSPSNFKFLSSYQPDFKHQSAWCP